MWSNKRKQLNNRSANIKGYLGGFRGLDVDDIDCDHEDCLSRETNSSSSPFSGPQMPVSVLVEIPEEFGIARFPSRQKEDAPCESPTTAKEELKKQNKDASDSAAVAEFGNNLMDLDNYMLSVFHMNDDATADTSFSSSNSSCSTISTRRRHRGAYRNRKRESRSDDDSPNQCIKMNRHEKSYSWLESMKKSSMNIFVEGEDGWTPSKGWRMANKTPWDSKPDGHWNNRDPIFDGIKKERLEI